jgi:hypothetical protein
MMPLSNLAWVLSVVIALAVGIALGVLIQASGNKEAADAPQRTPVPKQWEWARRWFEHHLNELILLAEEHDMALTVETVVLEPLEMGRCYMRSDVRPRKWFVRELIIKQAKEKEEQKNATLATTPPDGGASPS